MRRVLVFIGLVCLLIPVISNNGTAVQGLESLNLHAFRNSNSSLTVAFSLPKASKVSLGIHDITGKRIRNLVENQYLGARNHSYIWDGRNEQGEQVSDGIYFVSLRADKEHRCLKLMKFARGIIASPSRANGQESSKHGSKYEVFSVCESSESAPVSRTPESSESAQRVLGGGDIGPDAEIDLVQLDGNVYEIPEGGQDGWHIKAYVEDYYGWWRYISGSARTTYTHYAYEKGYFATINLGEPGYIYHLKFWDEDWNYRGWSTEWFEIGAKYHHNYYFEPPTP